MAIDLPFAQGFYVSESLPISAQECVNLRPNIPQTNTSTKQSLIGSPGLRSITSAGLNEFNRGLHNFDGVPYAVNGDKLYRIDRAFDAFNNVSYSAVEVGSGIIGADRVVMSDNGPLNSGGGAGQICIVVPESDTKFNTYIYTEAGGLVQLSSPSQDAFDGPVSSVVYVDGYFLFTKKEQGNIGAGEFGNKFFISNLRDGFTYLATDFSGADVDPDRIRAPFVLNNEVLIFGSQTFEAFENVGGAGFPFAAIGGASQNKGLDSQFAIVRVDSSMIFLGSDDTESPAIWRSNGSTPVKISTTAIDNEINSYTDSVISRTFAMTYSKDGAIFAVFTFPGQKTFIYDVVNGLWHTRESTINDSQSPWRVSAIVEAYGELIVGDTTSNKFGIIDNRSYKEYDELIKRRFVLPPLDNNGDPFFVDSIEVSGETGNGNTSGEGEDPQVLMSFSSDGGRTFGYTIPRSFGKKGDYSIRCIWDQLGRFSRSVAFKFDVSDPVKWAFNKVEANID